MAWLQLAVAGRIKKGKGKSKETKRAGLKISVGSFFLLLFAVLYVLFDDADAVSAFKFFAVG